MRSDDAQALRAFAERVDNGGWQGEPVDVVTFARGYLQLEEALRNACEIIEKLSARDPNDTMCVACDRDMLAYGHNSRCRGLTVPGGKLEMLRRHLSKESP